MAFRIGPRGTTVALPQDRTQREVSCEVLRRGTAEHPRSSTLRSVLRWWRAPTVDVWELTCEYFAALERSVVGDALAAFYDPHKTPLEELFSTKSRGA
jgi:hypothetical protein